MPWSRDPISLWPRDRSQTTLSLKNRLSSLAAGAEEHRGGAENSNRIGDRGRGQRHAVARERKAAVSHHRFANPRFKPLERAGGAAADDDLFRVERFDEVPDAAAEV